MRIGEEYYYQGDYGCDPQYGPLTTFPGSPTSTLNAVPAPVPPAIKTITPGTYGVGQGAPVSFGFGPWAIGGAQQIEYVGAYIYSVPIGLMTIGGTGESGIGGIAIEPPYHETID